MSKREWLCVGAGGLLGLAGLHRLPFPDENVLLQLVRLEKPTVFFAVKVAYVAMFFSTPYLTASIFVSLAYIFVAKTGRKALSRLPAYPDPARRDDLYLVVGETHHATRPEPAETPQWLVIPRRGLYTGIAILGAIGSGKTSACMYPFANQILAFRAWDPERRVGGLVLEVKGDFCQKIRHILEMHGRTKDYLEVSLHTSIRYNPLYNDLDAYTLAYGIASLLNNLFGKSKEPFWQQAYTNLIKFVILLHKLVDDYVTLFDVYEGVINPEKLAQKIQEGERLAGIEYLFISFDDFIGLRELETYPFERDDHADEMKAPRTTDLVGLLNDHHIVYRTSTEGPTPGSKAFWNDDQCGQFEAVKRWFHQDWMRMDARLRTSIVEGVSVFLSLFDDNPAVKRVFCPPKETYDPVANRDGRYGVPLPPFAELIERGVVCALNFPVSENPGLARAIGTFMKQDFQRAVLNRIPRMERHPERLWRDVLFLCDEYHAFATVGESDPSGDEKFFALSRQARCIPIVATHSFSSLRSTLPGESWRTLVQTFRTKVFLALSDDFSARTASEMCGKEEQLKANYSLSEQGQDAGVSVFTGRSAAHRATIGASKGYSVQRDFVFEPKVFSELKNAQAVVLAYDGLNPWPATYCYLKPHYLDPNVSYFAQLQEGVI